MHKYLLCWDSCPERKQMAWAGHNLLHPVYYWQGYGLRCWEFRSRLLLLSYGNLSKLTVFQNKWNYTAYIVLVINCRGHVREGLILQSHAECSGSQCKLLLLWFGSVSHSLCPDVNDHMKCKTVENWAWSCCWLFFSISSSSYCLSLVLQRTGRWGSAGKFSPL